MAGKRARAERVASLVERYRVTGGRKFRLAKCDPGESPGIGKKEAQKRLEAGVQRLSVLQQLLYADGEWALLMVLQAMDGGGKDGTIAHVMSGVNPQGVVVHSFKQPGPVELGHDFLWRIHDALPSRGQIGIFNRSHYEEVLVARLHSAVIDKQKIPARLRHDSFWEHRYQDIRNFELYIARQGIVPVKFFLHLSREEQRQRLLARLDDPTKLWKFSPGDLQERARWDEYQEAYETAIRETAAPEAPWYVVPADNKWFARMIVVEALIETLESLPLKTPAAANETALAEARQQLEREVR